MTRSYTVELTSAGVPGLTESHLDDDDGATAPGGDER